MHDKKPRSEETSQSLMQGILAHDQAAWKRLMSLYQPLVQFWCRRAGVSSADAEDVAQEVFAAAAAGIDKFHRDRPGDSFRGWLRGIARNQVLMYFRKNRRQILAEGGSDAQYRLEQLADPLPMPLEGESVQVSEVHRRALELVRGDFAEPTWQAFWLTAVEGRSPSALVDELGMSEESIRQAKSRVRRRLRQELGELLQ